MEYANICLYITTLNSNLGTKASTGHTHDDRYYTESEIDTKLSGKAASSHTHSNYSENQSYAWQPKAQSTDYFNPGNGNFRVMSTNPDNAPYRKDYLEANGYSPYGTIFCAGGSNYIFVLYVDVFGKLAVWSPHYNDWHLINM